ncbi:hypothetical protein GCM10008955_09370 [Deinococcus malanensis]|uniref:Transposase DDE domain-containing protein n=1 Tax=Deinococcus malanensis TaxID=1706855 RepID=A0ABQ2EP20_9DEIO|nr:hypothetical protein GCM10008955_09370 [Deinococcus malanensis]
MTQRGQGLLTEGAAYHRAVPGGVIFSGRFRSRCSSKLHCPAQYGQVVRKRDSEESGVTLPHMPNNTNQKVMVFALCEKSA